MRLQSIRIHNFKAIVDSKTVKPRSLTVFIGHNGSGKSSLIEALETYQAIEMEGLDIAMQRWLGIEHVRHKAQEARASAGQGKKLQPMVFDLAVGDSSRSADKLAIAVSSDPKSNQYFLQRHTFNGNELEGKKVAQFKSNDLAKLSELQHYIIGWQFLTLAPERMGLPQPQQRTHGRIRLAKDGSNIADFLQDIRSIDQAAFDGIVETMAYVLPYARDLQPAITSELERKAYLQLTEANFKIPGWMLSTGTLRILALLALLRHPTPPPLIVVEEIENGLDPRSIHLIVEEIRNAIEAGVTQVMLTTHSPYLLDLLTLEHLVLVERDAEGHPQFIRPADNKALQKWARDFAPGKLYTMGTLTGKR